MTPEAGIFERTHNAYAKQYPEETRAYLNFACGFMMGADLPGVAAAIVIALELAFPNDPITGHLKAIKEGH